MNPTMNSTLRFLNQMVAQQKAAEAQMAQEAAAKARGQQINPQFRNPGQSVSQALLRPNGNQARAMLEAGSTMLNRPRGSSAIGALGAGVGRGLDLLSELRQQDRQRDIEYRDARAQSAQVGFENANRVNHALTQAQYAENERLKAMQPSLPSSAKEYEYAVQSGYGGTYQEWMDRNKKPGAGGGATGPMTADQEREIAATHLSELQKVENVISQVDRALELVDAGAGGMSHTMTVGKMGIKSGKEGELGALIQKVIGANTAFDRLAEMRRQSPTGGALGQVSVIELEMLKSSIAALDPELGEEVNKRNLENIRRHYNNAKRAILGEMPEIDFSDPLYANNIVELGSGKKVLVFPDGATMEVTSNAN